MKLNTAFLPLLGLGTSLFALTANAQTPAAAAPTSAAPVAASAPMSMSAPAKVAVIDIQTAIIQTKDGQKAAGDLKTKFGPKQSEIEKKQADIAQIAGSASPGLQHHERRSQAKNHARYRPEKYFLEARQ